MSTQNKPEQKQQKQIYCELVKACPPDRRQQCQDLLINCPTLPNGPSRVSDDDLKIQSQIDIISD